MAFIRFVKTFFTDKYEKGNEGKHNKHKEEKEMLGFKKIMVFCKACIRSLQHINGTNEYGLSQERQLQVSLTKIIFVSKITLKKVK